MTISGILAHIAITSYQQTLSKQIEQDAILSLGNYQQAIEYCYLQNLNMQTCFESSKLEALINGILSKQEYYFIKISNHSSHHDYKLTATRVNTSEAISCRIFQISANKLGAASCLD